MCTANTLQELRYGYWNCSSLSHKYQKNNYGAERMTALLLLGDT